MEKPKFTDRLKHAWNVFRLRDEQPKYPTPTSYFRNNYLDYGVGSTIRTDRYRLRPCTERSIVASLYNKIAIDVAAVPIRHVKVNDDGQYQKTLDTGLNRCLNTEANLDQTGRELIIDAVLSMFDEGSVAIVPVETSVSIKDSNAFDIHQLRTGRIVQWYPQQIRVEVYNERNGQKQEVILPKSNVAIVENPFYSIMNEHNSTLKRLMDKLRLIDELDRNVYSNKLDLILQLPYTIKTPAKKQMASDRIKDLEQQLEGSKYGVAYVDGTERVTQLNRSVENKLFEQITDLKAQLYSELGITEEVFNGTADEKTMLNYQNGTVEPVLAAITHEMRRKFLTKTAQTQGQDILYVTDPFRLVPVDNIAEIADKFTRNEILSTNEIRSIIGINPVNDPRANELRNKNLNQSDQQMQAPILTTENGPGADSVEDEILSIKEDRDAGL